jgi:hypothetical protein
MEQFKQGYLNGQVFMTGNLQRVDGIVVMDKSEELYIKKGVEKLYNKYSPDSVLELGFGLGLTADKWQEMGITRHVIIESHPVIYQQALEWKEGFPDADIEIIQSFSQEYITEEKFDLVYDDRSDFFYEETPTDFTEYNQEMFKWLNIGGVLSANALPGETHPRFNDGFYFNLNNIRYFQPCILS